MRTTIEIPDSLYHRAKLVAAQRHTSLKCLFTEALESTLSLQSTSSRKMTSPPIRLNKDAQLPCLSNREMGELIDEDDLKKAGRV